MSEDSNDSKQNTSGSDNEPNFSDKYKTKITDIFANSIHDAGVKLKRGQGALDEIISIYFKKHREVSPEEQLKLTEEKKELKSLGKTYYTDISNFLGNLEKVFKTAFDKDMEKVSSDELKCL